MNDIAGNKGFSLNIIVVRFRSFHVGLECFRLHVNIVKVTLTLVCFKNSHRERIFRAFTEQVLEGIGLIFLNVLGKDFETLTPSRFRLRGFEAHDNE